MVKGRKYDFSISSEEVLNDILRDSLYDDSNYDYIEAIVNELNERNNIPMPTAESSWIDFRTKYNHTPIRQLEQTSAEDLIQNRIRRPRFRRRGLLIAFIIIMLSTLILVQAAGIDVIGSIAQWTKDIFTFNASIQTEQMNADIDQEFLNSQIPTWMPDGFEFLDEAYSDIENGFSYSRIYQSKSSDYVIIFNCDQFASMPQTYYEKDGENVIKYTHHATDYYFFSNLDNSTVAWIAGNCECSVSGPFTYDDAIKLINSIGESF